MKEKEGIVRRRWITILTIVGILDVVRSIEVRRLRLGKPKAPGPPDSMGCCQPKGCTEKFALNYDRKAVEDDGSCVFPDPDPIDMPSTLTQYQYYRSDLDPDFDGAYEDSAIRATRRMKGRQRDDKSLDPLSQADPYDGSVGVGSVGGEAVMAPPVTSVISDDDTNFGGYSDMWPRPINIPPVKAVAVSSTDFEMTGG